VNIRLAASAIIKADTLLITAGAGMGVDSGLPDFRGNQGFWNIHPNYAAEGLTFYDLANPMWFFTEPRRAWGFYGYRYNLYQNTTPHQGFALLKNWQESKLIPGFVYTSNVDGHFQKTGFAQERVYECHGSINHLQCSKSCNPRIWPTNNLRIEIDTDSMLAIGQLPLCQDCSAFARPNILMFDDHDWLESRSRQQSQRYLDWKQSVIGKKVVVIEIGAGSKTGGIRYSSQNFTGTLIRINPREPNGPEGTISFAMPALEALLAIDAVLKTM
jgi:NAD-dependent SIR2 family protein deacetylase